MRTRKKTRTISYVILNHIVNNLKEYFSVVLVFFIGIIIGVIFINNSNENQVLQIQDYINNFMSDLKECGNIDRPALLLQTFLNNLYLILALWLAGSTVVGIPVVYAIVAYKGFCLSYTISSSIITLGTWKGILFSISSMLLQNLIYIPCLFALAVSGIRLYKSIMKDKRQENIKIEIVRHIMFSLLVGGIMLLGTVVETYISTNLIVWFVNSI